MTRESLMRGNSRGGSGDSAAGAIAAQRQADSSEREAARVSEPPAADATAQRENAVTPAQYSAPAPAGAPKISPRVRRALATGGQPLAPVLRAEMERRFERNFAQVRIHNDAAADASARELGARAYTVGNHVAFANGYFAPDYPSGRKLLVHELTHVAQQADAGMVGGIVQLQPAATQTPVPAAAPLPPRTVKDVLVDLRFSRISNRPAIPALVQELLTIAEAPGDDFDLLNDGLSEVTNLASSGETDSADRLLAAISKKFKAAYVADQPLPGGGFGFGSFSGLIGNPRAIIDIAKDAALANDHARAFKLFGTAHEMLTMYAHRVTQQARNSSSGDLASRHERYFTLTDIYGEMREIYRFYSTLEAMALANNDIAAANEARSHANSLVGELKASHTQIPDLAVETAESTQVKTSKGDPAFRFHGANYQDLDLSELPGHPFSPDALASKEALTDAPLKDIQDALVAQAGFQTEIAYEPEVGKAFGGQDVDVNDNAQRLKLWRVMYGVYRRRGGGALGGLLGLIDRYLKAYGYHTSFNVRDFGTSYLDTAMPSDVAGRLVYDCGVYALRVAWDVFQTVKAEDSKLKVSFTLATFLDHIVLQIRDETADEYYLVNNDRITRYSKPKGYAAEFPRPRNLPRNVKLYNEDPPTEPPRLPDLEEEVGKQYAMVRDLPYLVTPVTYLDIGTAADSASSFKSKAWSRYIDATQFMAQVPVDFLMLEDFSRISAVLDERVSLVAPSANDVQALVQFLADGEPQIISMLLKFEQIGTKAMASVPKGISRPKGLRDGGTFRSPGSNHPLIRIALMMLRVQKLGGSLTRNQQQFLNFFEVKFKVLMDKDRDSAESGRF